MKFSFYQRKAHETAQYPIIVVFSQDLQQKTSVPFLYPAIGVSSEAGELLEKVKKIIRNNNGVINQNEITEITKEIGDVLWYLSELCSCFNLNMDDIAKNNLDKLRKRNEEGTIKSSGDNR